MITACAAYPRLVSVLEIQYPPPTWEAHRWVHGPFIQVVRITTVDKQGQILFAIAESSNGGPQYLLQLKKKI